MVYGFKKVWTSPSQHVSEFWELTHVNFDWTNSTVFVNLALFKDRQARIVGAAPVQNLSYQFTIEDWNTAFSGLTGSDVFMTGVLSALKTKADFDGATLVTDVEVAPSSLVLNANVKK